MQWNWKWYGRLRLQSVYLFKAILNFASAVSIILLARGQVHLLMTFIVSFDYQLIRVQAVQAIELHINKADWGYRVYTYPR